MPAMDAATKLTLGAGVALAILGLLGVAIGTWNFSWSGIILILAGLLGAAGGWIAVTNAGKTLVIAPRDIVLIGGTVGAVLGILFVLQLITDLDHLEDYGGAVGLIIALGPRSPVARSTPRRPTTGTTGRSHPGWACSAPACPGG